MPADRPGRGRPTPRCPWGRRRGAVDGRRLVAAAHRRAAVERRGGSTTPIPTTCAESLERDSYIGCDYWPTVTLNPVWSGFDFAVAVSNPQTTAVNVTITGGALTATMNVSIPANSVQAITLPWVAALKGPDFDQNTVVGDPGQSRIVSGGAYHLSTDVPVSVYQFNALEYEIDAGADSGACPGFASAGGTASRTRTMRRSSCRRTWPAATTACSPGRRSARRPGSSR